jgi:DNA processing protein
MNENNENGTIDALALAMCPGITPRRYQQLLSVFESATNVLSQPIKAISEIAGLSIDKLQSNFQVNALRDFAQVEYNKCRKLDVKVLGYELSKEYPRLLTNIPDPPPILYVRGTLTTNDFNAITIVGTREISEEMHNFTRDLSAELANEGFTIISGGAHGSDQEAHNGALRVGGRTIAVLGCGIDVQYPKDHGKLFQAITEKGAIISEFPLQTPPVGRNFPIRNRVMAALCVGVVVVCAPYKSGALITARYANEFGREVMACPGPPYDNSFLGTNHLIRDGATLITSAYDVVEQVKDVIDLSLLTPISKQSDSGKKRLLIEDVFNPQIRKEELSKISNNKKQHNRKTKSKENKPEKEIPIDSMAFLVEKENEDKTNQSTDKKKTQNDPNVNNSPKLKEIEETASPLHPQINNQPNNKNQTHPPVLFDNANEILAVIPLGDKSHIDVISARSGLTMAKTLVILQKLELEGYCQRLPGGFYTRTEKY